MFPRAPFGGVPYQPQVTRKKFSQEEDQQLLELVKIYGPKGWRRISESMPGRTAKQCRDRYCDYLNPEFFNGQWTDAEDALLQQLFAEYGPQWTKIAKAFANRNANSVRNRWSYGVSRGMWYDNSIDFEDHSQSSTKNPLPSIDEMLKHASPI